MVTINILLQNMDSRHMTLSIHSLAYAAVITNWLGLHWTEGGRRYTRILQSVDNNAVVMR